MRIRGGLTIYIVWGREEGFKTEIRCWDEVKSWGGAKLFYPWPQRRLTLIFFPLLVYFDPKRQNALFQVLPSEYLVDGERAEFNILNKHNSSFLSFCRMRHSSLISSL